MLHYGLITWGDISWSLFATGMIPSNCLSEPLKIMEDAWGEHMDLAKELINAMIGLWANDSQYMYHVKTSRDPSDGLGAWATRHVLYEGGYTNDYLLQRCLATQA